MYIYIYKYIYIYILNCKHRTTSWITDWNKKSIYIY